MRSRLTALATIAAVTAFALGASGLARGQTIAIAGRAPSHPDARALLQRWHDGTWRTLRAVRLNRNGRFDVRVTTSPGASTTPLRVVAVTRHGLVILWSGSSPPAPALDSFRPPERLRDYVLHLLFWEPPGTSIGPEVLATVNKLEADVLVALSQGARDNVFAVPFDYPSPDGAGDPRITSIDQRTDTDPVPPGPEGGVCTGIPGPCVDSAQIGAELDEQSRIAHWGGGGRSLVLLYLAPEVALCPWQHCGAASEGCGYHGFSLERRVYGVIAMSGAYAVCGGDVQPNGTYAVSITTHEQNEAIVDPGADGKEIADPCEGSFAPNVIDGVSYRLPELLVGETCSSHP
jgi:hypothetical protein